jgi:hypothetical protein
MWEQLLPPRQLLRRLQSSKLRQHLWLLHLRRLPLLRLLPPPLQHRLPLRPRAMTIVCCRRSSVV